MQLLGVDFAAIVLVKHVEGRSQVVFGNHHRGAWRPAGKYHQTPKRGDRSHRDWCAACVLEPSSAGVLERLL